MRNKSHSDSQNASGALDEHELHKAAGLCCVHTRDSTLLLPEARGQCADGKSLQRAQQDEAFFSQFAVIPTPEMGCRVLS